MQRSMLLAAAALSVLPAFARAGNATVAVSPNPDSNNANATVIVRPNTLDGDPIILHAEGQAIPVVPGQPGPVGIPVGPGQVIIRENGEGRPGMPNVLFRAHLAREKGAYLGVGASRTPRVLQKQLDLPEGMGLVVDVVVPDGPAAAAGLKEFDVLQKLDDQVLVNPEQLAVLVRSHKPGDEIKLTVVRQGKPTVLTAKLIEHDLEPLAEIEQMQNEVADQMRQMLPQPGVHPILPGGPFQLRIHDGGEAGGASSFTLIEGDRSYTVNTDHAGHKTFIVKDKEGKSIFDGLIDTPEQRAKVPDDLKAKLDHLEHAMPHDGKIDIEPPKLEENQVISNDAR